ncbi:MAG: hypothetical protein ACT4P4_19110 [Betaproteobacteria bacterium]
MSGAAPPLRFSLGAAADLALHVDCVVYRAPNQIETLPLAALTAVRVAFERDARRIGWGAALVVAAALLFLLAGPLGRWADGAAAEISSAGGYGGVARALEMLFHGLEALAAALPVLALACAAGGGMLGALGWRGDTVLTLSLAGSERVYSVRGLSSQLMEFAEMLAERLVARSP